MKPCWSCGAYGPCYSEMCECAKCLDPEGYEEWKSENSDEYAAWLDRQKEEE